MYQIKKYTDSDFIKIRDFLQKTYNEENKYMNWLIDRWNFVRYFSQIMHKSYEKWPETVGIWEDKNNNIKAVVNSEGNTIGSDVGEVFFQLDNENFNDEFLNELIDFAEKKLKGKLDNKYILNIRVDSSHNSLKEILKKRGYKKDQYSEELSCLDLNKEFNYDLPKQYKIEEARNISFYERGFAHGKAFGYYKNNVPDDDDAENCYKYLSEAPDYSKTIDLVIVDENDKVAVFSTMWFDEINKIGILEPVGTVPEHRKRGLAKCLIYEEIKRIKEKGARKVYVGSNQDFYLSLGFKVVNIQEIWQKEIKIK